MSYIITAAAAAVLAAGTAVSGATNPFAEDFVAGPENWVIGDGATPPAWSPGGGPDAPTDSFIGTQYNFVNDLGSSTPILFEGNLGLNSSGSAFTGDYIAAGITQISFKVRHFAPAPLSMYYRVAPQFGAGFVATDFAPNAFPGVWNTVTFDLSPTSTQLLAEGTKYNDIFSDVWLHQIGVAFPSIAGTDADIDFQIDDITITPAPGTAALLLGAPLLMRRRRN